MCATEIVISVVGWFLDKHANNPSRCAQAEMAGFEVKAAIKEERAVARELLLLHIVNKKEKKTIKK